MFNNRWAFFWFENAEFGRGPTSNAQACTACHTNNGRGLTTGTPLPATGLDGAVRDHHITVPFEPAPNLVVRISVTGRTRTVDPSRIPTTAISCRYSGQGGHPRGGQVRRQWHEHLVTLADGEQVACAPHAHRLRAGLWTVGRRCDDRVAAGAALVGLGLLEAIPEETIVQLAARAPVAGIRGRVNRVWDESQGKTVLGRFGLKANHGSLREQVAAAFINDIGLSTPVYPEQNCPAIQSGCKEQMVAGKPEITPLRLIGDRALHPCAHGARAQADRRCAGASR